MAEKLIVVTETAGYNWGVVLGFSLIVEFPLAKKIFFLKSYLLKNEVYPRAPKNMAL